jgi:hypothetical protein
LCGDNKQPTTSGADGAYISVMPIPGVIGKLMPTALSHNLPLRCGVETVAEVDIVNDHHNGEE